MNGKPWEAQLQRNLQFRGQQHERAQPQDTPDVNQKRNKIKMYTLQTNLYVYLIEELTVHMATVKGKEN